ncbi:MAG: zinc-ribbon domain containing protein [Planctomycetes bacterium]|nr:zinc-ribbon domain containing protein [Planctomycetota bacterium]
MEVDRKLKCVMCGETFTFSAAEQKLYAMQGLHHEPKRCRACRETTRRPRPRDLHITACATCGQEAQVPFLPKPGQPVYCADCYARARTRS